jgi:hypothetical protein
MISGGRGRKVRVEFIGELREGRAGGRIELPTLGCELLVDDVYLKVFA